MFLHNFHVFPYHSFLFYSISGLEDTRYFEEAFLSGFSDFSSADFNFVFMVRAITSVSVFYTSIFTLKTYFFYFTRPFLQNSHINLSILSSLLNTQFFQYFSQLPLLYTRALSLSTHFSDLLLSLYTHLSTHLYTHF